MEKPFSTAELREIQDALCDGVLRMCQVGQSSQEVEYESLKNAWSARKKVIDLLIPAPLPAWVAETEEQVREAIANPKII